MMKKNLPLFATKRILAALAAVFMCYSLHGQDFNTMTGDWIRAKAEYSDGRKLPSNHDSRLLLRYHFTKKEAYMILSGTTLRSAYTRTGNVLKFPPLQSFVIEEYTDKALTLVQAGESNPIRYYLIPTDSFQVSGILKYPYEVVGADTIYSDRPGIEPIYLKGNDEFMRFIMEGFTQTVGFNFTYVVKKDGTIGDIVIIASTNPKLDKRLIQRVTKTSGNWIPATFKGKPIHVRLTGQIGFSR